MKTQQSLTSPWKWISARGAILMPKSATGRIRRGEPGAAPQDYRYVKLPALKARFTRCDKHGRSALKRAFSACWWCNRIRGALTHAKANVAPSAPSVPFQ
jgi:hypothetical protein